MRLFKKNTRDESSSTVSTPILGSAGEPAASYIVASTVAEQVKADVDRAGYAAASASHVESLRERATAQVEAAAPLPVDDRASIADRAAVERVDLLKKDVEAAHVELESSEGEARRAGDSLNELAPPWSFAARGLVVVITLVGAAICVYAVGKLMASSFDAYFLRPWVESLNLGDAAPAYAAREAQRISFSVAAGVIFLATIGTLALRRASWWVKALPLVPEVLLSISFAVIRLGGEITFSAMAVSGLELAVLLGHVFGLVLIGMALDHDQTKREPFTKALRKLKALLVRADLAEKRLRDTEFRLAEQVGALQRREDAVRALPAVKKLVDATASAEYVTAISRLVEDKAAIRDEEAEPIGYPVTKKTNGANAGREKRGKE